MENIEILQDFYKAYEKRNLHEISKFYHSDVEFYDHAFGILNKNELISMWSMLFNKAFKDLSIEVSNIKIENNKGFAHIECDYIYTITGRKVRNIIDTTIEFKNNKRIKQTDIFNLKDWAKQSLGWKEGLLAGTSYFKRKLQNQTRKALNNYIKTKANTV